MATNEEHEQRMRELQRSYVEFLDDSDRWVNISLMSFFLVLSFSFSLPLLTLLTPPSRDGTYDKLVREMVENKGSRLVVSINDLRTAAAERADALLRSSFAS